MILKKIITGMLSATAICAGSFLNAENNIDAKVFDHMAGKLDKGGSFYSISNTTYLFDSIAKGYNDLETQLAMMPMPVETKTQFAMGMMVVKSAVAALGLNEVKALAGSSVVVEPGINGGLPLFRNRYFVYHGDTAAKGLLWSLAGDKNQPLKDLSSLPANTVMAASWPGRPGQCWNKVKEIGASIPAAQLALMMAENAFQQKNQMPLGSLLDSISGQWSLVVTEEKTADGKLYMQAMLAVPATSGTAFNLIKKSLAGNNEAIVGEKEITFKPNPSMPQWVSPLIRQDADRLLLVSHPAIIAATEKAATAKDGWVKTSEYQRLAKNLPAEGTGFFYVSRRYAQAYGEMLKSFTPEMNINFSAGARDCFMVFSREKDGVLFSMNGNLDLNEIEAAKFNVVAIPIVAGMMMPALNSSREKARRVSCASNLKQIGLALKKYSLDNKDAFPTGDNVAGLGELVKKGYLADLKVFACPSDDAVSAELTELKDENCSYIYLGGFLETDAQNDAFPLAFDVPGAHADNLNVLFSDGHVEAIKTGDIATCAALVTKIGETRQYKPELLKKLQDTAKRIDSQLGLGEE